MIFIRKAVEGDFPTIIEIMQTSASIEELKGFVPPGALESRVAGISPKFLEELRKDLQRGEHGVIVAEKDGKPVGFAYFRYERDCIGIEEIDVRKEYQQQGIGKALVQLIEKNAREKGIKRLGTGTSINKEGKPWKAYGFWIHMGFVDTGKRIESDGLKYVELVKSV